MVKGKTRTGFKFTCDGKLMHDVEFLEEFAAVQKGDGLEVFDLIKKILGADQKQALYEHIRNEEGIVTTDALHEELSDIFEALGEADETKN